MLTLVTACSSPSVPAADARPLGNVTATPRECGLISTNAIQIATGFKEYRAIGTKMSEGRFASCSIADDLGSKGKLGLVIRIHEPSPLSPEGLKNTKATTGGRDLPGGLGPGFASRREDVGDQAVAFVYGWTSDYEHLLSIEVTEGAPGRDSLADAVEFFRQLKPLLLTPSK
ncbi:hypothetical protein [Nonomuraea sp. WAC 01424]|uniref:hypothetical protein n=1 Tax=Nonomuraea sp. WAC 01424 TaxID=2203200 RepID=UPI000F77D7AA|nr:hypothetical protein [Nonomuraea sp. WAC 01424]